MITVIADDITGAAEIAGIGLRFGKRVSMVTTIDSLPNCDLLVYVTDTRSMSEQDAVRESRDVIYRLWNLGCYNLFKKTDSALRGHVIPELRVIMKETGFDKVLLIPQNPSKNRIIKDGIYYIDGEPLHKTSFASDPEFPTRTADVMERLNNKVTVVNPSDIIGESGIFVFEAVNKYDIEKALCHIDRYTLLAGGADFFTAWLILNDGIKDINIPEFEGIGDRNIIVVCGSTVAHSLADSHYFRQRKIPFFSMPSDVFDGGDTKDWLEEMTAEYKQHKSAILSIGHPPHEGKEFAVRLRNIITEATTTLIETAMPQELVIEGGATAFGILEKLKWNNFNITDEIAPGIVRMSLMAGTDIHITLKPGSYAWGENLFK